MKVNKHEFGGRKWGRNLDVTDGLGADYTYVMYGLVHMTSYTFSRTT
jgi:hypothetical protein